MRFKGKMRNALSGTDNRTSTEILSPSPGYNNYVVSKDSFVECHENVTSIDAISEIRLAL